MAIQLLQGPVFYPGYLPGVEQASTALLHTLNDANDYGAFVIPISKTGTLHKIHFKTGTVTTGDTLRWSFSTPDSDGLPGTEDQFRTILIDAADDNVWLSTGILTDDGTDGGVARSVSKGDLLSVQFRFDSFVAGNMTIAASHNVSGINNSPSAPLDSTNAGSTWNYRAGRSPIIALEYSDGSFAFQRNCYVFDKGTSTLATTTSPDEYAIRFKSPGPIRVDAASWNFGTRELSVYLTTDGDSVLAGPAFGLRSAVGTGVTNSVEFSSAVDLAADTWYKLRFTPTSTSGFSIALITLGSASFKPVVGVHADSYMVQSRTDGGSWTDHPTLMIPAWLSVVGIGDGSGGGGGGCALVNGTAVIPPTCT